MPFDVEYLIRSVTGKREMTTHGTGSGKIYVEHVKSADGVVDIVEVVSLVAPSNTDTFNIGSEWKCIAAGAVKKYIKTAASTWVVQGTQT